VFAKTNMRKPIFATFNRIGTRTFDLLFPFLKILSTATMSWRLSPVQLPRAVWGHCAVKIKKGTPAIIVTGGWSLALQVSSLGFGLREAKTRSYLRLQDPVLRLLNLQTGLK
jgi:hypothetical protein